MDNSVKVKNRKKLSENIKDSNTESGDLEVNKEKIFIEKLNNALNCVLNEENFELCTQLQKLKTFEEFDKILKQLNNKNKRRSKFHILTENWDIALLCLINIGLIIYLIFFTFSYISPESYYVNKFSEFNKKAYEDIVQSLVRLEIAEDSVKYEQCALRIPSFALPLLKPIDDCQMCINLTEIKRVEGISKEEFLEKYAYTGVPVVVTDAMKNWTGGISFEFLKNLYQKSDEIAYQKRQAKLSNTNKLKSIINTFKSIVETDDELRRGEKDTCQFFPYKTSFRNLREVFELEKNADNRYDKPWYVGWSNCNGYASEILRKHYKRPYFLPNESEMSRLDWIFMGTPEYGAAMHIDDVNHPSWQAQISGIKLWTFKPPAECFLSGLCSTLQVNVFPGDVIVFDSNRWYHSTFIKGDEISLTIGSEYD